MWSRPDADEVLRATISDLPDNASAANIKWLFSVGPGLSDWDENRLDMHSVTRLGLKRFLAEVGVPHRTH